MPYLPPGENKVNKIFLIPFIFFVLLSTVSAEQFYKCVDAHGNKVITTSPQDGMKCETGKSNEESSSSRKASKSQNKSSENLVDICNDLYSESEKISNEIKSFDPRLAELQKEQFYISQRDSDKDWNYRTESEEAKHIRDEQYKINKQISLLHQKQSLISNDIRIYKCDQLNRDLSNLNHSSIRINNPASQRKSTFIMRNGNRSVIIRD